MKNSKVKTKTQGNAGNGTGVTAVTFTSSSLARSNSKSKSIFSRARAYVLSVINLFRFLNHLSFGFEYDRRPEKMFSFNLGWNLSVTATHRQYARWEVKRSPKATSFSFYSNQHLIVCDWHMFCLKVACSRRNFLIIGKTSAKSKKAIKMNGSRIGCKLWRLHIIPVYYFV